MDSWELGDSSDESARRINEPLRRIVLVGVGVMDFGRNGDLEVDDPRPAGSMLVVTAIMIDIQSWRQ